MTGDKIKQVKAVFVILCILATLAFFMYQRISPSGFLFGIQNDLVTIVPEEAASYMDLEGNPVTLASFKGKPLIINAWATWMPFSQTELLLLNEEQLVHKDAITILAINRKEDAAVVKAFLSTFSIGTDITMLVDPSDYFYTAIGGYAMPETVFYRRDGTIQFHKRGVLSKEELQENINRLLAE